MLDSAGRCFADCCGEGDCPVLGKNDSLHACAYGAADQGAEIMRVLYGVKHQQQRRSRIFSAFCQGRVKIPDRIRLCLGQHALMLLGACKPVEAMQLLMVYFYMPLLCKLDNRAQADFIALPRKDDAVHGAGPLLERFKYRMDAVDNECHKLKSRFPIICRGSKF